MNIEEIAAAVGATREALYHYFKSREKIIAGVMYKAFEVNNTYLLAEKQEGL